MKILKPKKYGLVIQGGTLRSIFTAGVLDAFLLSKYNPFKYIVGVSGGAMCMAYYLSKQLNVSYHLIKTLSSDSKFMNWLNMFSEEGLINLSYLEKYSKTNFPINIKKLNRNCLLKKVEIVTTSLKDGTPVYLSANDNSLYKYLRASASIPFLTKGKCIVNNLHLMDGGWSDPIPVKRAIKKNCTDIVVIRTQPICHREEWSYFGTFGGFWHRDKPKLSKRFNEDYIYYNETADFLEFDSPNDYPNINIHQIAPLDYLKTSSYSTDHNMLDDDYRHGLHLGLNFINKIKK